MSDFNDFNNSPQSSVSPMLKKRGRRPGIYKSDDNRRRALDAALRVLHGASIIRRVLFPRGPIGRIHCVKRVSFRSERTREEAVNRALRTVRAAGADIDDVGKLVFDESVNSDDLIIDVLNALCVFEGRGNNNGRMMTGTNRNINRHQNENNHQGGGEDSEEEGGKRHPNKNRGRGRGRYAINRTNHNNNIRVEESEEEEEDDDDNEEEDDDDSDDDNESGTNSLDGIVNVNNNVSNSNGNVHVNVEGSTMSTSSSSSRSNSNSSSGSSNSEEQGNNGRGRQITYNNSNESSDNSTVTNTNRIHHQCNNNGNGNTLLNSHAQQQQQQRMPSPLALPALPPLLPGKRQRKPSTRHGVGHTEFMSSLIQARGTKRQRVNTDPQHPHQLQQQQESNNNNRRRNDNNDNSVWVDTNDGIRIRKTEVKKKKKNGPQRNLQPQSSSQQRNLAQPSQSPPPQQLQHQQQNQHDNNNDNNDITNGLLEHNECRRCRSNQSRSVYPKCSTSPLSPFLSGHLSTTSININNNNNINTPHMRNGNTSTNNISPSSSLTPPTSLVSGPSSSSLHMTVFDDKPLLGLHRRKAEFFVIVGHLMLHSSSHSSAVSATTKNNTPDERSLRKLYLPFDMVHIVCAVLRACNVHICQSGVLHFPNSLKFSIPHDTIAAKLNTLWPCTAQQFAKRLPSHAELVWKEVTHDRQMLGQLRSCVIVRKVLDMIGFENGDQGVLWCLEHDNHNQLEEDEQEDIEEKCRFYLQHHVVAKAMAAARRVASSKSIKALFAF